MTTKSGLMVGLGETMDEIYGVLEDLRAVACDVVTVGQYLNPIHTDGMKAFILGLRDAGFTNQQIDTMARGNAAKLLGLDDGKPK